MRDENAYRRSEKKDDKSGFSWSQAAGSDHCLFVGSADQTENVSIDISIPAMRRVDTSSSSPKYLPDISITGCSPLLDDNHDRQFPLILMQYHGQKLIRLSDSATIQMAYIEFASPMASHNDPTTDEPSQDRLLDGCINLTPDDPNSVGSLFLRRYYTFMSHLEHFRFTARLPWHIFLQVYRLTMPQPGSPSSQFRWLMIGGQLYLPEKITYEFSTNTHVLATIECAREHPTPQ